MEQEERLADSSLSIISDTIDRQPAKSRFHGLSKALVILYIALPFFRQLPDGDLRTCTAHTIEIPRKLYCWLEVAFAILLVFMTHYVEAREGLTKEASETSLKVPKLFVCGICILTSIITSIVDPNLSWSLVTRVPLLICCSQTFFHMAKVYINVLIHNLKYFLLMWMSICLFWATGDVLFSSFELPDSVNFFQSFFEVAWNLLVLQSTANFPDVSLPFLVKSMASMIYFVMFLFCNTIIISNLIIANSYNAYKENTESYELTEGLPKVLLEVMKKK